MVGIQKTDKKTEFKINWDKAANDWYRWLK